MAGGRCFRLPQGTQAVPVQVLRPAPLAQPVLLGITMLGDLGVPVLAAAPGLVGGPAWVLLPDGVLVAGDAYADQVPPDAPLLAPAVPSPRPPPAAIQPDGAPGWVVPSSGARGRVGALALELGGLRLVLPFAALERVIDLPAITPAPGANAMVLGLALAEGEAVLVLDPAALAGHGAAATPSLLVLFRHAGRRLGLPCARMAPAEPGEKTLVGRLDALLQDMPEAPLAQPRQAPMPEAMIGLLLARIGDHAFALPVEDVTAAIAPMVPTLMPTGMPTGVPAGMPSALAGVVAHRGDVLPVRDGGRALGLAQVLAPGRAVPLLRLNLPFPVALAVTAVTGLQQVPTRLVSAAGGQGGLIAAIAAMPEGPLPICRTAILAGQA